MRVSETPEINIPDDGLNVDRLERYLTKEIERFGKQVFGKVLQQIIEERELAEAKGRVSCREKVPQYLFTRLGLIRLKRHKVKYKEGGRFGFLLDDVLGLKPHQGETRWVRQLALELAVKYPYRQAKSLLRHEIGDEVGYRSHHPRHLRQPTYSVELVETVLRLREEYPRWGKDKLVVLLHGEGFDCSASMVGRILHKLKERGVLKEPIPNHISARKRQRSRPYAIRKPKEYIARAPGDIVEVDTLDVRPLPGVTLKHFTACVLV